MPNTTAVPDLPGLITRARVESIAASCMGTATHSLFMSMLDDFIKNNPATQPAPSGDAVEVLREALEEIETMCKGTAVAVVARAALAAATSRAATVAKEGGIDLRNVKVLDRSSDMSVTVRFASCRAASQFANEIESRMIATPKPEASAVTPDNVRKGGLYNWKNQPERLVYLGRAGSWHQFAKVQDTSKVWCEVLGADLEHLEETEASAANQQAGEVSASDKQAIEGFDQVVQERDHYHEMADKLAEQIAAITATDIGEHSSSNCPWESALQACDEYWALASKPDAAPISEGTKGDAFRAHLQKCSDIVETWPDWKKRAERTPAAPAACNGDALTNEQIAQEAAKYSIFAGGGQYDICRYECEEDFYNCVRACVVLAARAGTGSAGSEDADYVRAAAECGVFCTAPQAVAFGRLVNSRATKVEAAPGNAGEGVA